MSNRGAGFRRSIFFVAACWLIGLVDGGAAPQIVVERHQPSNLFAMGEPVHLEVVLRGNPPGRGQMIVTVTDYFGQEKFSKKIPIEIKSNEEARVMLEMGDLGAGYYECKLTAALTGTDSVVVESTTSTSLGVAPFRSRTREDVLAGKFRFGLKLWTTFENTPWNVAENLHASEKLGLQWTRSGLDVSEPTGRTAGEKGFVSTADLLRDYAMIDVLKVERFPVEFYDVARYGPLAEWEKKHGTGAWSKCTLPQEVPYKKWLKQQIANLPAEQNIFEIWNEPWNKMAPEDFATLCQWIVEVINTVRPHAIIGPNLYGKKSAYEFDARFIKAGGMKGMSMITLHPYSAYEDRGWLRDYRSWLHEQLGRDVALYVTEFGAPSTPEGPAKISEIDQARRVTRHALEFYAEDIKAFMPHTMGGAEKDPTYLEDWFGLFRLRNEPKPALMAYANAAYQIDGSRYVGDLWYGTGVDAMLFERKGIYTLALWTRGEKKEIEVSPGVEDLSLANMVGSEKRIHVDAGKLHLTVDEDITYLVGVSAGLEKQASREIDPRRWPKPARPMKITRTAHLRQGPLTFDGNFKSWDAMTQVALLNPKIAGDDASGVAYIGWDPDYLYIAVDIRDNEMLNREPRSKLYLQDSLELFVSTEPREENVGFGPHDHQFFVTPTSGEGKAILAQVVDREAGRVEDVKGAKFFAGKSEKGWCEQVAIPWKELDGFSPGTGTRLALEMILNDADSTHERFSLVSSGQDPGSVAKDPTVWSLLSLEN